jgi:hypothetical protein
MLQSTILAKNSEFIPIPAFKHHFNVVEYMKIGKQKQKKRH